MEYLDFEAPIKELIDQYNKTISSLEECFKLAPSLRDFSIEIPVALPNTTKSSNEVPPSLLPP